jgi:pilus assembly protein CpaB
VTLEVTPEQAENLDLARSVGTLSLVLRNQVDPKPGATEGATKMTMLREQHLVPTASAASAAPAPKVVVARRPAAPKQAVVAAAAPIPPKSTNCIEVIRGTVKSNECF